MSIDRNKELVRAFAEAMNERDWERLDELVDPKFMRHSSAAPPVRSREELKEYLRSEFETFPDGHESIEDKVAVRHGFRGTQRGTMGPYPASGKVLTAGYLAIYRIAGGVIAESWAEWDNLSGLMQLGHIRPKA